MIENILDQLYLRATGTQVRIDQQTASYSQHALYIETQGSTGLPKEMSHFTLYPRGNHTTLPFQMLSTLANCCK